MDRLSSVIKIGDHIEKINDKNLVGSRHFEVAKLLKEIPVGTTFTLKLVEPTREGFRMLKLTIYKMELPFILIYIDANSKHKRAELKTIKSEIC